MEGSGEDPYLGSILAVAHVKGYQGKDLSADNTILACVKHYAAYGGLKRKRLQLRRSLGKKLAGFLPAAIQSRYGSGAGSIMASF